MRRSRLQHTAVCPTWGCSAPFAHHGRKLSLISSRHAGRAACVTAVRGGPTTPTAPPPPTTCRQHFHHARGGRPAHALFYPLTSMRARERPQFAALSDSRRRIRRRADAKAPKSRPRASTSRRRSGGSGSGRPSAPSSVKAPGAVASLRCTAPTLSGSSPCWLSGASPLIMNIRPASPDSPYSITSPGTQASWTCCVATG
jgi:hypothetical protein